MLETLVESGLVEALGNGRGRNYMLSSKAYGADNAAAYVRQKGIDEFRDPELARKQGEIRRTDVVTLLHISAPKAYRSCGVYRRRESSPCIAKAREHTIRCGRKMSPELYDKNTTQTGNDLCPIYH